jgi:hypothetical protein
MKISEKGNLSKTYQGKYIADKATLESIKEHLNAKAGNPHKVTASDVGSYTKGEVDGKISDIIVQEMGSDPTKVMSQKYVTDALTAFSGALDEQLNDVYTKEQVDELIAAGGGVKDAYTKEEVDVILQNYAKKQQSFDGIIYLDFNDGVLDTYALDNATVPGIYRVIVNDDNDILAEMYRNQYILLVGNTTVGEELVITQTRMSDGGLFETRSRSVFDEGWSEWLNNMLGDIDTALDAILAIQSEVVGDEA